jgi:hypothetical protein
MHLEGALIPVLVGAGIGKTPVFQCIKLNNSEEVGAGIQATHGKEYSMHSQQATCTPVIFAIVHFANWKLPRKIRLGKGAPTVAFVL